MTGSRRRCRLALAAAAGLLLAAFAGTPASADVRVLDRIEVRAEADGTAIAVLLNVPMRMVTHVPAREGDLIQVQVRAVSSGAAGAASGGIGRRQVLRWKPSRAAPLLEVSFEEAPGGPQVVFKFTRPVRFRLRSTGDLRSLVLVLPRAGRQGGRASDGAGGAKVSIPVPPVSADRLNSLMAEAERAMTAGEYRTAIRLYTKIARYPDHAHTRQAQELLALARERNGQLAHARAEYEEYLRRYPKGEAAERVRQRLAALLTAKSSPKGRLRQSRDAAIGEDAVDWDIYGSVSQFYRRDESFTELDGRITNQSAATTDVDVTGKARTKAYEAKVRLTSGHTQSFLAEDGNETRINTLYLDVLHRKRDATGRIGRQSRSSGGVLGRFDGGLLGYRVSEGVKLNAVGGFPVESTTSRSINTDTYFFGLSADFGPIAEFWEFNIFAINQVADGISDRRAVGGEARYSHPSYSLFSQLDYDILFGDLNSFLFVGNYVFESKTTLNMSLTYRKSPTLTTSNALQGQTATSLSSLLGSFSEGQIHDLAEDRTATNRSMTLSASHPLNETFQISGDFTVSTLSDTETSGGVAGTPGTGAELFYSVQLLGSNLIKEGDIGILGLRYSDTSTSDTVSIDINTRYPGSRAFRINPRFRIDYRRNDDGDGKRVTAKPSLRLNYRWNRKYNFELETGGEWSSDTAAGTSQKTVGYFVSTGVRADF